MLPISLAIGAVTTSFASKLDDRITSLSLIFCGIAMILLSIAMERIGSAIRANSKILSEFGASIGDCAIMRAKDRVSSSAFWIALAVAAFGGFLLFEGASELIASRNMQSTVQTTN